LSRGAAIIFSLYIPHFNVSLLGSLRAPLKTIRERLGHALTGSLILDGFKHAEWKENSEVTKLAGDVIEKAVNIAGSTAIQKNGFRK
jgi:hypothetical protein